MLLSLLLCGCASRPSTTLARPAPPEQSLLAECPAPPRLPAKATTLRQALPLLEQRAALAAECRARHRALADWARGVTQP
ncbi:Rz1-like lysis system protein LysC [Eleftheria terrae]|uniref:Rz1-like lysis system protein LysC n=1 Tax=Eleftheria terrae TaxID=1597781 RepID=UPI003F4E16DE